MDNEDENKSDDNFCFYHHQAIKAKHDGLKQTVFSQNKNVYLSDQYNF